MFGRCLPDGGFFMPKSAAYPHNSKSFAQKEYLTIISFYFVVDNHKIYVMNEKILSLLKQTYSSFGLGDALLKAIADGLAAGATEENIESLVAAQKPIIEAMQKANDKRATDAVNKAKAEAEIERKTANIEFERQRAELAKQIEQLQKELNGKGDPTPPIPPTPPTPPTPTKDEISDWIKAAQEQMAEQMKSVQKAVEGLKKENDDFKAAKAAEERKVYITNMVRELGIPDWREKEGFNITDSMSNDEIKTYLSDVANNIRTNITGSNRLGIPQLPDNAEAAKESAKRVAAALVDQM